jgi:polysaccharide export outer membrane protein
MSTLSKVLSCSVLFILAYGTLYGQVPQDAKPAPVPGTDRESPIVRDSDGVEHPQPAERNPRYNQKVTVQPDGYITLQGAGSTNILGLTVPQTVDAIKKAYSTTLHDPMIDVDLIDFQKAYFIVTGQVTKPGQYDLRYDLTVSEAIALAGGFMPTAKTKVYLYHRSQSGWVEAKELKLSDFLHGKNVEEDVGVRSGDMIFVPEKSITKIRKYVPYGVGLPVYF